MAKGAIDAYTLTVPAYCAQGKNGMCCNSVHPSGIDTPIIASFGDQMLAKYGEKALAEMAESATGKFGELEDVAYAALYLASDE